MNGERIGATRYFGEIPAPVVLLGSLFLVGFLGVTDFLTGAELSFSIFYLIPVTIATLRSGFWWGLGVSLASATVWLTADLGAGATYSLWLIPYWNAVVRLGYFTVHGYLLSRLTGRLAEEERRALFDPLTEAASWRYFREYAGKVIEGVRRSRAPVTAAYMDLDNFKAVNDRMGHDAGDHLLRTVADVVRGAIRGADMFARVGGDEFALLLPQTGSQEASALLLRLKKSLDEEMQRNGWPVSVSVGAVTFNVPPPSVDAMLKRADDLMYAVKSGGKNDVRLEQWPPSGVGAGSG
ncbi:MAG: GGDEF domain-containing protein [Gemmatimonadetes bacterium]|nr:GGDEF domain-containing protein [Gemmatimonadota bacterium]